jgi:hypothetical protein
MIGAATVTLASSYAIADLFGVNSSLNALLGSQGLLPLVRGIGRRRRCHSAAATPAARPGQPRCAGGGRQVKAAQVLGTRPQLGNGEQQ